MYREALPSIGRAKSKANCVPAAFSITEVIIIHEVHPKRPATSQTAYVDRPSTILWMLKASEQLAQWSRCAFSMLFTTTLHWHTLCTFLCLSEAQRFAEVLLACLHDIVASSCQW